VLHAISRMRSTVFLRSGTTGNGRTRGPVDLDRRATYNRFSD
jgi:hypothetical protein